MTDEQRYCAECGWVAFNRTYLGPLCRQCGRPVYMTGPPAGAVRAVGARRRAAARQLDAFAGRDVRGRARQLDMFSTPAPAPRLTDEAAHEPQ